MVVRELYGTVVGRWYVMVLGVVYLVAAVRHLGWRKTGLYTVAALAIGALAENGSVHLGVPYTRYAFNSALRGKEVFLGDVPLMVPLSYTFMGYFAFATGRLVVSGPWRTRGRSWGHEYLMALVLAVWAIWTFDPVARLGNRWFLGRLFHYAGPGFWFGLPVGSQLGFTLTAGLLIGLLAWMTRNEPDLAVSDWRRHPHLISLATYHGQILWLAVVAWVLEADTLGGSAVLMWVPAALVTVVYWSSLRPRGGRDGEDAVVTSLQAAP